MRHNLAERVPQAVQRLPGRMAKPAGPALLVAPAGGVQRAAPRVARAQSRAVALPAITGPAQVEELPTGRPAADDQSQGIHALPRSGRGGLDNPDGVCEEGSGESRAPK